MKNGLRWVFGFDYTISALGEFQGCHAVVSAPLVYLCSVAGLQNTLYIWDIARNDHNGIRAMRCHQIVPQAPIQGNYSLPCPLLQRPSLWFCVPVPKGWMWKISMYCDLMCRCSSSKNVPFPRALFRFYSHVKKTLTKGTEMSSWVILGRRQVSYHKRYFCIPLSRRSRQ